MGAPIWTKFGSLMQKKHADYGEMVEIKPEVEFQYGGRLFFKNGSSYISAVNWDMSALSGFKPELDLIQKILKDQSHLTAIGKTVMLCWISSHVNIRGNEKADRRPRPLRMRRRSKTRIN